MSSVATRHDRRVDVHGRGLPSVGALGAVPGALAAVVVLLVAVAIFGFGPMLLLGAVVAVAVGFAVAWFLVMRSTGVVVSAVGGRPADGDRDARLINITEGLALTAGMAAPELRVTDDRTINGLAVGGVGGRDVIVVTRGALDELDRIQLEGLVAHLIARSRRPEQASLTAAVTTLGLPGLIADRLSPSTGPNRFAPTTEELVALDQEASGLTRFPPGLAGALEAALRLGTAVDGGRKPSSHLWFAPTIEDPQSVQCRLDAVGEL